LNLDKLKGKLREKRLSYNKVAEILGVSTTTVSSKMNGETRFYLEEIRVLSDYLGLTDEEKIKIFFD
jgi:transcriptional regulator with XRE-family HTH domain